MAQYKEFRKFCLSALTYTSKMKFRSPLRWYQCSLRHFPLSTNKLRSKKVTKQTLNPLVLVPGKALGRSKTSVSGTMRCPHPLGLGFEGLGLMRLCGDPHTSYCQPCQGPLSVNLVWSQNVSTSCMGGVGCSDINSHITVYLAVSVAGKP